MLEACKLTVWSAWALALGPESLLIGLFLGWTMNDIVGWFRCRPKRIQVTNIDGSTIPANTRVISSDGETFFTTRKALVLGGYVTVPVRKDPMQ